jgi:M6 family metalloprotease-like protein
MSTGRRVPLAAAPIAVVLLLAPLGRSASAQVPEGLFHPEAPRAPGVTMPLLAQRGQAAWNPLGIPGLGETGPLRVPNASNLLVIPALFSDSPEPHVSVAELRRVLFDGPSDRGTFTEFYQETSRGLVTPTGIITDWVRTDVSMFEAAGNQNGHGWIGSRMRDYVIEALQEVAPAIDFRLFDNDGPDGIPDSGDDDGYVDGVVIEFLGVSGSCGGPAIWPHFGGLGEYGGVQGWPTDDVGHSGDPIRVRTYLTQSVTQCDGVNVQGPNVIAHEYGHLLGLPDIYQAIDGIEPGKRHWNIGCFGLMGAGSWGCGTTFKDEDFGPVHLSVLMKQQLGWMEVDPVGVVREQTYHLEPAQTTGRGLSIGLGGGESLLVEYRPRIGFDHYLPAGGVLVYHVDTNHQSRSVPSGYPPAKRYHLIEADGDHALRKVQALGGNRGVAADVFGIDGRLGPYSSAPNGPVRLYNHEGAPIPVTFHEIVVEPGEARARVILSTDPQPAMVASEVAEGLRILDEGELANFRLAGGALPYEVTSGTSDFAFEAEIEGTAVRLVGRALEPGAVTLRANVTDALGTTAVVELPLTVGDLTFELDELIDAAILSGGADATARAYVDARGNRNGAPDVGDLRAVLRERGGG